MTGFSGAIYGQCQMFISPNTVSGISVSLQIGFDNLIYGALRVIFIIFLPYGIVGSIQARFAPAQ